jgi:hypothetical protein
LDEFGRIRTHLFYYYCFAIVQYLGPDRGDSSMTGARTGWAAHPHGGAARSRTVPLWIPDTLDAYVDLDATVLQTLVSREAPARNTTRRRAVLSSTPAATSPAPASALHQHMPTPSRAAHPLATVANMFVDSAANVVHCGRDWDAAWVTKGPSAQLDPAGVDEHAVKIAVDAATVLAGLMIDRIRALATMMGPARPPIDAGAW